MSEIFNECNVHPTEQERFKRSVLRTLIARNTFREVIEPVASNVERFLKINAALGVDAGYSLLVNECADRIASGECSKYQVAADGLNVSVTPKEL